MVRQRRTASFLFGSLTIYRDMPDDTIREIAFSEYPKTLQNMHRPPKKLYIRGKMPGSKDQRYLCVVGSRRWTTYGRDAVHKIVRGLKGYPISIVSGLALGIDSIAHMAALEAGLHCLAFPGSCLEWDKIYPSSHEVLAKRIVASGGALVSQWDAESLMGTWAFPSRNVLMAGISDATLVVEAAYRSGSLMTAKHAEEFHRDVLAIPGSINSAQSYGPHMLIREGARIISSAEDVLKALGFNVSRSGAAKLAEKIETLDPISAIIMKELLLEERTTDILAEKIGLSSSALNEKLTLLELEGLIKIEGSMVKIF